MPHLVRVTGIILTSTLLLAVAVGTANANVGRLSTAAATATNVGRLSIAAAATDPDVGRLSIAAAAADPDVGRLSIAAATATEDPDPPDDSPLVCLALVAGTALLAGGAWMATLRRPLR